MNFQSSFIQHGLRSHLLPFNTGTTDPDTEILRVLHEARKVSRGIYTFHKLSVSIMSKS